MQVKRTLTEKLERMQYKPEGKPEIITVPGKPKKLTYRGYTFFRRILLNVNLPQWMKLVDSAKRSDLKLHTFIMEAALQKKIVKQGKKIR